MKLLNGILKGPKDSLIPIVPDNLDQALLFKTTIDIPGLLVCLIGLEAVSWDAGDKTVSVCPTQNG